MTVIRSRGAVAVVADAHLGGPGGGAGPLVDQLHELADRAPEHLVFLGDLFQAWVGFPVYETDAVVSFLGAVDRLRRGGVEVTYVEGNRDFFVGEGPYGARFDRVVTEVDLRVADRRVLFVHGDGLNARDWSYRFWRWASKSWPTRLAMTHLPGALARRLVDRTERRLQRSNFRHKREIPHDVIQAYGTRRLAEGYDLVVLGHFHEPIRYRLDEGEVLVLDAWFHSRRIEWIGGDRDAE